MSIDILSVLAVSPPFESVVRRLVIIETGLPAIVQQRSDAVYFRLVVVNPDGATIDLTRTSSTMAILLGPDGSKTIAEAVVEGDPSRGVLRVTSPSGYMSSSGRWKIQAVARWPDGAVYFTPPQKIKAKPNL